MLYFFYLFFVILTPPFGKIAKDIINKSVKSIFNEKVNRTS